MKKWKWLVLDAISLKLVKKQIQESFIIHKISFTLVQAIQGLRATHCC